jgi:hypothetical protein
LLQCSCDLSRHLERADDGARQQLDPESGWEASSACCAASSNAGRLGALPISARSQARMRQGLVPTPPQAIRASLTTMPST